MAATEWATRQIPEASILVIVYTASGVVLGFLDSGKILPPEGYRIMSLIAISLVCVAVATGRMETEGLHPRFKRLAAALAIIVSLVIVHQVMWK